MSCIFCKIINKEAQSDVVYEDGEVLAFKDAAPKAPIHILIIPKKHIPSINYIETDDKELIGQLFFVAKNIAKEQGIAETGYRLLFNAGNDAGQTVDHLHLHLIGGRKLPWA